MAQSSVISRSVNFQLSKHRFELCLSSNIFVSIFQTHSSSTTAAMPRTAGILIIGDEILKGHTQDTNSHYICKVLHSLGVNVCQINVIGDQINTIASQVKDFSSRFDMVLTSGGIGPTHDDLTMEGVAKAFTEELHYHPTLVDMCKKYFGNEPLDSPRMKLAYVPTSTVLRFGVDGSTQKQLKFPLMSVKNVFIFPGIPVLMQRQLDNMKDVFKSDDIFFTTNLLIDAFETDIANVLTSCMKKYEGDGLTVGSYPDWFNNYYKVKLTIESTNSAATDEAVAFLHNNLPTNCVLRDYKPNPLQDCVSDVFGEELKRKSNILYQNIIHSAQILEEALSKYGNDEICIGFNGGKDCTALLHLYYAVVNRRHEERKKKLLAIYIKDEHPFDELERFMEETIDRYALDAMVFEGDMKDALSRLHRERPSIRAVVMGTRTTDPHSKNLEAFSPTDADWPPFMRVNPILSWSYHDIWTFLRTLNLPYCVLYDRGYTSLGSRDKTERNAKLVYQDGEGHIRYQPAYTLQNPDLERNGRL